MAVEPDPTGGWDPKPERDPKSERDPKPEWDPPTPPKGPPEMLNPHPTPPPPDPEAIKQDPAIPQRDPAEGGDPQIPKGDPLFLNTSPGGVTSDRWHPQTGPMGRPRRPPARTRLRNRRYAALRQLIQAGEYFSEEEMRAREPLLYQHYIGQYQGVEPFPGDPQAPPQFLGTPPSSGPPQTLTGLLLRSVEEAAVQQRLRRQRLRDGDSTDEEEDEDGAPHVPDAAERAMLREEFTSRMYQRFLDGEDGDFDYSQVDDNPDLDNLDIVSRDAEERYFDEEEPSDAPQLE